MEKQASEDRLKAELTELQAEIAQLLSPPSSPSHSPEDKNNDANDNKNREKDEEEEEEEEDDRFPMFHMFILALAVLSSAIALTTLFPYIGFMIIDVGVASNINEAGYYSGAIGKVVVVVVVR